MTTNDTHTNRRILRTKILFQSLLIGGALCVLPGCFRVTALIPDQAPAEKHTQWVNGFFWGAVGGNVDVAHFCAGRGVASIETKRSVGNYLIELLTLGIYTPSHIAVTCGQPRYMGVPGGYPGMPPNPYMTPPYVPPAPYPYTY